MRWGWRDLAVCCQDEAGPHDLVVTRGEDQHWTRGHRRTCSRRALPWWASSSREVVLRVGRVTGCAGQQGREGGGGVGGCNGADWSGRTTLSAWRLGMTMERKGGGRGVRTGG